MSSEAFILISIGNASISTPSASEAGVLALECVTASNQNLFLVLRLNSLELVVDPARRIVCTQASPYSRLYTFKGSQYDPTELFLTVGIPPSPDPILMQDLDTMDSIFDQYADFQGLESAYSPETNPGNATYERSEYNDYRGQLVLINQDNGEIVGELDRQIAVHEDPRMYEKGHEKDPVVIEVASDEKEETPIEFFARVVAPDQRNIITNSAHVASFAISTTTNLLLTVVSAASKFYISHSKPSPHHSAASVPTVSNPAESSSIPPAPPPRAVAFFTSEKTRKGMSNIHTYSGKAVKLSGKTVGIIDDIIYRAVGGKQKKPKATPIQTSSPAGLTVPAPGSPYSRPSSPSPSSLSVPPPYSASASSPTLQRGERPPLPPRRSPSPSSGYLPSPTPSYASPEAPSLPSRKKLSTTAKIVLSADLILSTIEASTKQLLNGGTETVGSVMGHKYGPEAAQTSTMAAGTARNVALVYIDVQGVGRRALVKKVAKTYIKNLTSSDKEPLERYGRK